MNNFFSFIKELFFRINQDFSNHDDSKNWRSGYLNIKIFIIIFCLFTVTIMAGVRDHMIWKNSKLDEEWRYTEIKDLKATNDYYEQSSKVSKIRK